MKDLDRYELDSAGTQFWEELVLDLTDNERIIKDFNNITNFFENLNQAIDNLRQPDKLLVQIICDGKSIITSNREALMDSGVLQEACV